MKASRRSGDSGDRDGLMTYSFPRRWDAVHHKFLLYKSAVMMYIILRMRLTELHGCEGEQSEEITDRDTKFP